MTSWHGWWLATRRRGRHETAASRSYAIWTLHGLLSRFWCAKEESRPDLHIVFGPNEAGKTTAFEGYLDLLFGIPGRSKYNFLHEYENMRVGGALELDGNAVELVRIKRNKGDLVTPSGEPANPAQLSHALDGIDREQYRAMFSLDDETIEAGGEDILASQGNLGELLFSAAAGLSDLGAVLETARGEVDQFHKARARKTELAEAKRKLQDLHAQIRELDVPASAFRRLKDERDAAARASQPSETGQRRASRTAGSSGGGRRVPAAVADFERRRQSSCRPTLATRACRTAQKRRRKTSSHVTWKRQRDCVTPRYRRRPRNRLVMPSSSTL
jgi:hypothetical protein